MKKTIFLLAIVALFIALFRWLTSDKETKQKVEETRTANNEKEENVKPETNTEEVKEKGEDTVKTITNK